jgi:hypothetical protein
MNELSLSLVAVAGWLLAFAASLLVVKLSGELAECIRRNREIGFRLREIEQDMRRWRTAATRRETLR